MRYEIRLIRKIVSLTIVFFIFHAYGSDSEFNIDVLNSEDIENVDMSQFSIAGYILPGSYALTVFVNGQRLGSSREIDVFEKNNNDSKLVSQDVCIPKDMLNLIGIKESEIDKVKYSHADKCLDLSALDGVETNIDLSSLSLKITIPQFFMKYNDPSWIPPELWENGINGINGIFTDYSANISITNEYNGDKRTYLSTNGISGINLGAWRFRGDYSANYQKQQNGNKNKEISQFSLNRLYAFTS